MFHFASRLQLLFLLIPLTLSAPMVATASQLPAVDLYSRNMPVSCEYVFAVDSELYFEFENPAAPVTSISVSYQDEYSKQWSKPQVLVAYKNPQKPNTYYVPTLFRSMSTNPKFLLRKVAFVASPWQALGGKTIYSEFGRQFGEKCFDSPSDTPFVKRALSLTLP